MQGLNFGHKVEEKNTDTIPKNTLLWCVLAVRGIKNSRETNGRYLDIELTVLDNQPYARRKIWDKLADPFDGNNSEEWRNMGYLAIRRILEAVKGATPENANSYSLNRLEDLHGLTVPVIVGIEKGKDGYEDKNRADYLSPHSTQKKIVEAYRLLMSGVNKYGNDEKPAVPQKGSMFTGTATPPPAGFQPPAGAPAAAPQSSAPGWLAAPQNGPAAAPAPQTHQAPPQQGFAPQPAQPVGFPQGTAPAQPQQAPAHTGYANAVPPQSAPMNTGHPAAPAGASPSNQGWAPPAGAPAPAQFPTGGQNQ